jgi:hypothetical protein
MTGTYSDAGTGGVCKPCSAGTYQDEMAKSSCKPCPAGTYQDQTGQIECKACPDYRWSYEGSASCSPFQLKFFYGYWYDGDKFKGHPNVWLDAGDYALVASKDVLGLSDPDGHQDYMGQSGQIWNVWLEGTLLRLSDCRSLPCTLIGSDKNTCDDPNMRPNCTDGFRHTVFYWGSPNVRLK